MFTDGFEVIPGLDLRRGRLARMPRGDRRAVADLPGDPVDLAARLVADGAAWLHVADLDAAIEGSPSPANLDVLRRIVELAVPVQAGGSLSVGGVRAVLEAGAARAVLGAAALADRALVGGAIEAHGERVGVALDVGGGRVAPRGSDMEGPDVDAALDLLVELRPAFVTYTNVGRDGVTAGPDLEGLARVLDRLPLPVIASGGVRTVDDLRALAGLRPAPVGAIVGRALAERAFTVAEAQAAVHLPS
ncbi:MAG TPA: HisA/HisF-related TIM barrel protein [Actinomycetota bacterium]|nr:HisA/HisF-related TIM barrel protein [Actinomycetota bacterium]